MTWAARFRGASRLRLGDDLAWRGLLVGVLAAAFALQVRSQAFLIRDGRQGFLIGDWLISYAGGFVRRGLIGEVLLAVTRTSRQALFLLFVVQTLLYGVIFGILARWAMSLDAPKRWSLLLLSPGFLVVFGFNDFAGTHRKEIIAFAGLLVLAEAVRCSRFVRPAVALAGLLFALAVFSHEATALLVVPFLWLVRTAADDELVPSSFAWSAHGMFLGIAAAGAITGVIFSGAAAQRLAICGELLSRGFDDRICGGAISYIGAGMQDEASHTVGMLPGYFLYGLPALLATLPLALSAWARDHRRALLLTVAPLAPLLLFAVDWGRWIMWAATVATILTVVHASRLGQSPDPVRLPLAIAFFTAWSLPHSSAGAPFIGPARIWRAPGPVVRLLESMSPWAT